MLFTLNNRSTIRDNVPLNSFNNTSALGHMRLCLYLIPYASLLSDSILDTSTSHIHTELRFATNVREVS